MPPNTAWSGRSGLPPEGTACGVPNSFLGLIIFPLGRGNPVRPSAMLRERQLLARIF